MSVSSLRDGRREGERGDRSFISFNGQGLLSAGKWCLCEIIICLLWGVLEVLTADCMPDVIGMCSVGYHWDGPRDGPRDNKQGHSDEQAQRRPQRLQTKNPQGVAVNSLGDRLKDSIKVGHSINPFYWSG